jgi:hypothetical protein
VALITRCCSFDARRHGWLSGPVYEASESASAPAVVSAVGVQFAGSRACWFDCGLVEKPMCDSCDKVRMSST